MRSGGLLVTAIWLCACSRSGDQVERPAPRGSAVLAPAASTAAVKAASNKPKPAAKPGAKTGGSKPNAAPPASAIDAGREEPNLIEQDELKTEEPEANPHSESVTLKLSATPQVKALVLWGAKQMGQLEPGKMEAEITRQRGSGPLDLEIKAEGYLPYHTRLYADRNDKIGVRLYRPEEAPNLFGYKRSAEGKKAEAEKQEKLR